MNIIRGYFLGIEQAFDAISGADLPQSIFEEWMDYKLKLGPVPPDDLQWPFLTHFKFKGAYFAKIAATYPKQFRQLFGDIIEPQTFYNITYCVGTLSNIWFLLSNKNICEAVYSGMCSWNYGKICKQLPLHLCDISISELEFFEYLCSLPYESASLLIGSLCNDVDQKWALKTALQNKDSDGFLKILFNNRLDYDVVAFHAYFLCLTEKLKYIFKNEILREDSSVLSDDELQKTFVDICQLLPDDVRRLSLDLFSIRHYIYQSPERCFDMQWDNYYKLSLVFLYAPLIVHALTLRCADSMEACDKMNCIQEEYKQFWSESIYEEIFLEHKICFDEEDWFKEGMQKFYNQFVQEEPESEESAPPKNEVEEEEPSKNIDHFSGDTLWTLDEIEKIYLELRKLDYINDSPYTKTTFLYRMVSDGDGRKKLKPKNLIVIRWKGPRRFLLQLIYFCYKRGEGRRWKKAKQFFYIERCPKFDYKGCTREADIHTPEFDEFLKRIE